MADETRKVRPQVQRVHQVCENCLALLAHVCPPHALCLCRALPHAASKGVQRAEGGLSTTKQRLGEHVECILATDNGNVGKFLIRFMVVEVQAGCGSEG